MGNTKGTKRMTPIEPMRNNLRVFRTAAGVRVEDLADGVGVSLSTIYHIEQRGKVPNLQTAYAIANVLNVSVYDIWPDTTEVEEEAHTVVTVIRRVKR